MCGRYRYDPVDWEFSELAIQWDGDWGARYNVSPTQVAPVILDETPTKVQGLRWGLIPSWAKDATIGSKLINARAETVEEKPSFRAAFKKRRCVVLTSGFYEWQKGAGPKEPKTPHVIRWASRKPMLFAGLWETNQQVGPEPVRTFTILTCDPNTEIAKLHNRQPVLLTEAQARVWLSPESTPEQLKALLHASPPEGLEIYPVSRAVNNPANDNREEIEPEG